MAKYLKCFHLNFQILFSAININLELLREREKCDKFLAGSDGMLIRMYNFLIFL